MDLLERLVRGNNDLGRTAFAPGGRSFGEPDDVPVRAAGLTARGAAKGGAKGGARSSAKTVGKPATKIAAKADSRIAAKPAAKPAPARPRPTRGPA
jgi:hypothetical protein